MELGRKIFTLLLYLGLSWPESKFTIKTSKTGVSTSLPSSNVLENKVSVYI
jgi:hypothetical protein